MLKQTAILVPCYKRVEYTAKCIKALEDAQTYEDSIFWLVDDASKDGTAEILQTTQLPRTVVVNPANRGLRNIIVDFFYGVKDFKYIVKMDNDCLVPKDWLKDIVSFLDSGWADIVSPNVYPSNAAYLYGKKNDDNPKFRPSKIVGGLWAMRTDMIKDIDFERVDTQGIRGAFSLLNQILLEKEPRIGWLPDIVIQDLGHWSGSHPEHIKSEEHLQYSVEVGRNVAWG